MQSINPIFNIPPTFRIKFHFFHLKTQSRKAKKLSEARKIEMNCFSIFYRFSVIFPPSLWRVVWKKNNKIHFTSHHRHFLHNIVVGRHATHNVSFSFCEHCTYVHSFFHSKEKEEFLQWKKIKSGHKAEYRVRSEKKVSVQDSEVEVDLKL